MDSEVLFGLKHVAKHLKEGGGDKLIRKGVCRAIASFTAGTSGQLQVRKIAILFGICSYCIEVHNLSYRG
jgi:hypothetical protein